MEKEFKTMKGWWVSANIFEDVYGYNHVVYPYCTDLVYYKPMFPLACYMLILDKTVKQIVIRDDV